MRTLCLQVSQLTCGKTWINLCGSSARFRIFSTAITHQCGWYFQLVSNWSRLGAKDCPSDSNQLSSGAFPQTFQLILWSNIGYSWGSAADRRDFAHCSSNCLLCLVTMDERNLFSYKATALIVSSSSTE